MAQDREKKKANAAPQSAGGPELRLLDRRAFVGFPSLELAPGVTIADFALLIPDVTFPFNLAGGPARYQRKTLQFGFLELMVDAEVITRELQRVASRLTELEDLQLRFRPSYLEAQARLRDAQRTALTFKIAFDGDGERLAVYLYDVRLYGFSATPAAQLPATIARAVADLELLPGVERRGATGFTTRILPPLCQLAAVSRGYKVPTLDHARLSAAEVSARGLRLRFASGGLPPAAIPDEELLLTIEGARAFADAEALVAEGKLAEARAAYLKLGDVHDAHPFAAERLLSLLAADPSAHELASDVAQSLLRRRERSATALWADGVVRERRGEAARAAERFLALTALARSAHDDASAFHAAEAAARAAREQAPQLAVKALHELLGIRPDHLPSLKALARASDQAKDRAGAIRAYRRIAALAREQAEAAEAHLQLARLCAETEDDVPGARLHCEAALKLAPDHPEALLRLGELCHRAGEHLRALKALDRLREVALVRHEIDRVGQAALIAGRVWEEGLGQHENALLRYREAVSLLPHAPEPHYLLARAAERLNKLQEALAGYQQCIELAGPAPAEPSVRKAAHAARHALAKLARTRLADPAQAREHLEAALLLDPKDQIALEELIPYFRATGRAAELADACQKAAAASEDPVRRAAFWAEAGELFRGRLGEPEKADRLLNAALEADPQNRAALEGMLALAESRRDGGQLCRCLKALAELSGDPKERARLLRRLSVAARDLAFDLDLATWALGEVLRLEPEDLSALGELCGLHRKRADMNGLVGALDQRARVAEGQGDRRLASAALREMSQVLELRLGRIGEALAAMEKAARLAPDHGVLLDLADLALRCERPDHARRALEDLLGQLPRHAAPERIAEIRARLGRACELLGDREGAKEQYAQAFPLRRLDDALAARLESLYLDGGQLRDAAELWAARAQALLGAGRQEPAAALYLRAARALVELADRPGALVRLEAALEASPSGPDTAEVLEQMAELELERGGKLEAARLLARRAGLMEPGRDAARLLLRSASLAAGTPREREYLTQAIDLDPMFPAARARRAELLSGTDAVAALADLELALDAPQTDPDAVSDADRIGLHRSAARIAARAQRLDVARRHLTAYTTERADDVEARLELAELHRAAGAKAELCDLLAALWPRLAPAQQSGALREYAELSLSLSRTASAITALRSLLSREPSDAWAARALLGLLPAEAPEAERLHLLGAVIAQSDGAERGELLARRAELHSAAGRATEALRDLLAAAELSAAPRELLRRAAQTAREVEDAPFELGTLQQILAGDPSLADELRPRLLELARARLHAQDFATALEGFSAAASGATDPAVRCEAQLGIAEAAMGLGDRHSALAAYRRAASEGPRPRRLQAALAVAALAEQAGDDEQTVAAWEAVLVFAPHHAGAEAGLERALTRLEDWEGLAELLASQATHVPRAKAPELLERLAELYLERLDAVGPAEAALRRVIQLDRTRGTARAQLAALLFERGELQEAVLLLEQAAALLPEESAAELLRGGADACFAEGALDEALRLSRRAAQLTPAQGEDLLFLGRLLYARGAVQEALPHFRALAREVDLADDPETAEEVLFALADLLEENGDPAAAETVLRRVLDARPLQTAVVDRLAGLIDQRDPRAGLRFAIDAWGSRARTGRDADRLVTLAERAHTQLADLELAVSALRRAAQVSTDPLAVHRRTAELLRDAGRTVELSATLEEIARLSAAEDPYAALEAFEELARLAEEGGRVDAALAILERARNLWEEQGVHSTAAVVERRRAELLRDAKLDLDGALRAFAHAFELAAELQTAQLALSLCRYRDDASGEALWLRRCIDLTEAPEARAARWLELAGLQADRLASPVEAEASARSALELQPQLAAAETLLVRLLEQGGRTVEIAQLYEERAGHLADPKERAALFSRAAALYRGPARRPELAVPALLAARAATPEDLSLTLEAAELLREAGRFDEAAEFDALLLEEDPLRPDVFERHCQHLEALRDHRALASLHLRRAERQSGDDAAESFLAAARALRGAGAREQAQLCETRAFEAAPSHDAAFQAVRARAADDVRQLSEILSLRATAVPREEAVGLLRERAEALLAAREELLAAEAFDALLALTGEDVDALSARAELAAAAGGPVAAQPYDRRLLDAGGEALPQPVRVRARLRLGHAALARGALIDAADAFEEVVLLDEEGPRGREALSVLSEVHARTGDAQGLYRTTLRLARLAAPDEADALLRRAASLFDEPAHAIDALLPLARKNPADAALLDRAVEGLAHLARHQDVVELCEKGAAAVGGSRAAELLLQAAKVAAGELDDPERAYSLQQQAALSDPQNVTALSELAEAQRRRDDSKALRGTLAQLLALAEDDAARAPLRLELAELARASGEVAEARRLYEAVFAGGPTGEGYRAAVEGLAELLSDGAEPAALAPVLAARAELLRGAEKATLLLDAARAHQRAGELPLAAQRAREAAELSPSLDAVTLLASLHRSLGEHARAAAALVQASELAPADARGAFLLEAAEAREAAGENTEAAELLERAAEAAPYLLPPATLADRLLSLGQTERGLEIGYGAALEAGDLEGALALAERAQDTSRARKAAWAIVERGDSRSFDDAVALLDRDGTAEDRVRLARGCEGPRPAVSRQLYGQVARDVAQMPALREVALERLIATGSVPEAAREVLGGKADPLLVEGVLRYARALAPDERAAALEALAGLLPARRISLLDELLALRLEAGEELAAAGVLERRIEAESEPRTRAGLRVQLGELRERQGEPALARAAFELALSDDSESLPAVRRLVPLYAAEGEEERFLALSDRLARLAGDGALQPYLGALADVYERRGRRADAYRALCALEETPERLKRRATLAAELGLVVESLELRERLAATPEERERVLFGYVEAGLVPFAARLGERMAPADLSYETRRLIAERLSPTGEGAALAARYWPELLRREPLDADGWTLFAEALQRSGRSGDAALADGFGAALTSSNAAAPIVELSPLSRGGEDRFSSVRPTRLVPVTPLTMPRLDRSLSATLQALGMPEVMVSLDPEGGVAAYLMTEHELVLGAGALAAFGAAELNYLCALAVALGDGGQRLASPGPSGELAPAAASAFRSVPGALAAGRVLAQLDDAVRGGDPLAVDCGRVLKRNPAFRAVALEALARLAS